MSIRVDIDEKRIGAFCRKWKVTELALFGSVLRDDFGPGSDIDALVELAPDHGLSLFDWVGMIDELRSIFGGKWIWSPSALCEIPFAAMRS
jgi:hypothetical protein